MTHYKPDPDPRWQGCQVSDETPIPRHEFTQANDLHAFPFDADFPPTLHCPNDCGGSCTPSNLGELVDWALGHKCEPEWAETAAQAEKE